MDKKYMQMALTLAEKGRGRTSPNPMVGCVIVNEGKVVGKGYHQRAGTPHAEVHALEEAGQAARGSTLYVNLEPCSHYGRTPPCTKKIIEAGVQRVVIAMVDPNPVVAGKGIAKLKQAGIKVDVGLCRDEAMKLNEVFIKYITTGLPFVVLKTAMTLDGKIATVTGESRWITGIEARNLVHQLRNTYRGIMVGVKTVIADDPLLTVRLPAEEKPQNPVRIIVDSMGNIPVNARVLQSAFSIPTIVAVSQEASQKKISLISEMGAKVLVCKRTPLGIDLQDLMRELGKQEIDSILLEGGGSLNFSALRENIVDKILCFISPKIIGGDTAPTWVRGEGVSRLDKAFRLENAEFQQIGEDFLISGYVERAGEICLPGLWKN